MKTRLLICALALAAPLGGHAYTVVTDEHVDLEVRYSGGVLGGPIRADSGSVPRDEGLLYDGPVGTTSIARPASATWDFLGVGAGQPIFFWPQSSVAGRMYLGFGSDGGAIPPGTFQSYLETDPRVNLTAAWNKITLLDVRYEPTLGVSGSAHFSLWQTDGVGGVDVWMSTFDGGITSTDATWLIAGGHAHYNWGFSKSGYYQIDFRYSGYLAPSGTYIEGPTQTFHFGVEYQPPRIPTDIAARGPLSIIGNRPPVDFRINKAGTTGSIELAAGVTSISSLQQNTATAATVNTAAKTLRAGSIEIVAGKAALTIGAAPGDGTLTAATAGGNLVLDNDDATAALSINAAIANHTTASSVTKTGVGEVHLRGAQNYATLNANEGTTHLHTALGSGTSSLLVASGATAKISASQTLAALTIGAGGTVIFTSGPPSFAGAAVPEPAACALLALGMLGLAARRRRTAFLPAHEPATKKQINNDNMKSKLILTLAALSATAPLYATTLSTGHVDLGVAFEEGAFHLHIHDEDTDTEFEPDEAILQVGALAHKVRPAGAAYNFLGNPGDMLWILEQVQNPSLLFLGIGSEEIADGTLTGDEFTFSLVSVTHANGGHFSLYEVDGFNNPTVKLNSGDGITGADSFVLPTGGHMDFNWAFTQEGEYEIDFKVDGFVGVTPVTQTATYTFDVVPEPGSTLLLATGALALIGRRRRA